MNSLRIAIVTIIVLLFGANMGVWYYKSYGSEQSTVEWNDWDAQPQKPGVPPKQARPVQPTPIRPAPVQPAPVAPAVPAVPRTYGQALAAAQAARKPLFLFFTSAQCYFCTEMRQDTLAQPQIQQALQNYVVFMLDVNGPDGYVAASCNIQAVPYYLVVNPDTRAVLKAGSGYKSAAIFQAWLQQ